MTLSRRDLELGRMREVYVEALAEGHALTDAQLSESLGKTLTAKPRSAGWWVFAYGSLLWNPIFPFAEARRANVHGLHRRFCLWSLATRGTPKAPGLVLGLDRGGSCRGIVYRLHDNCALDELSLLWRREMVTGAYEPRWLDVDCEGRRLTAIGFVVRREHSQYAGHLTIDAQAEVIARACGVFGSSADYLERTRVSLASHGVTDRYLERLASRVAACKPLALSPVAG
ncbi:MAG TPA: gamma-glutamylcyclotransferase [Casimicrobiaceae bacterium]|jgi:cation transport protein ChaC|nr:gamma-glutamylcyclotransferase [Casimicrobiaceae bacterium]HET9749438.1 gamma-glutamylcyclotransferase [Casimicrobiaceae bacterium]HWD36031.1 gamma-glutamylcyclotransferase [Casimicrobiaceae bacterium]